MCAHTHGVVALSACTGRQQENPNIAWEKVTFDKTLVDLEPEQVIS